MKNEGSQENELVPGEVYALGDQLYIVLAQDRVEERKETRGTLVKDDQKRLGLRLQTRFINERGAYVLFSDGPQILDVDAQELRLRLIAMDTAP